MMSAPCGWTVSGCTCGDTHWATLSAGVAAYAEATAATIMWSATGRQYGPCDITVRPCGRPPLSPLYQTWPVTSAAWEDSGDYLGPILTGGIPDLPHCGGVCSCSARCEVELDGPTTTTGISKVTVAGVLVPATAYEVQSGNLLVRTDGTCWPSCTNYSDPAAAFEVTYQRGRPIPPAVQYAFERLACEFAKACVGTDCALPTGVRQIIRQGVTIDVASLIDLQGRLRTGITEVDAVIAAVNPVGLTQPPLVMTPDIPHPRILT